MARSNEDPIITLYRDSFHDALLIYLEKERAGKRHLHASPKAYLLGTARI